MEGKVPALPEERVAGPLAQWEMEEMAGMARLMITGI
jgi:hypothetical protein